MRFNAKQWVAIENNLPSHNFHLLPKGDSFAITVSSNGFERMIAFGKTTGDEFNVQWLMNGFQSFFK